MNSSSGIFYRSENRFEVTDFPSLQSFIEDILKKRVVFHRVTSPSLSGILMQRILAVSPEGCNRTDN